ncbi:MAG: T9SS type A sorting domain-containing protein [Ignavibacteriaceae bacterium]|nr:T9SS type A sorting domain-containing protein [Ignavibacteriaceae bacterium]
MKLRLLSILFFAATLTAIPQIQIIDDFEAGVGRFINHTGHSGSTSGIIGTVPVQETLLPAHHGTGSLKVLLVDDPLLTGNWFVRLLSGTGNPANNMVLNDTGWVGYWMKSNRSYIKCGFILDDLNASGSGVGTNELSDSLPVAGDDQWHLYQWQMEDTTNWYPFIASGNGMIQDPVTIDAIVFTAPQELIPSGDTVTLYLDFVAFNPTGDLPVELTSFDFRLDGNNVDLRWITSTEINNKGFEVQRHSGDGNFVTLGFVEGHGTTTNPNGYVYRDVINKPGKYYYRLKQVDFDGTFEYSKVIEAEIMAVPGNYYMTQNYPNPFNPNTQIAFYLPESGVVDLAVYNLLGQRVMTLVNEYRESGSYSVKVEGSDLSSGTYIYRLNVNGQTFTRKMTLLK